MSMNISIRNVARVKKAQIDIDGITVVAGLNGTGKTTISKGIYASINAYKSLPERIVQSRRDSIYNVLMQILRKNEELAQNLDYIDLVSDFSQELPDKNIIEWVADNDKFLSKKYLKEWFAEVDEVSEEEIDEIVTEINKILLRTDNDYTKFLVDSYFNRVFKQQINCFQISSVAEIEMGIDDRKFFSQFRNHKLTDHTCGLSCDKKAIYIESYNILDLSGLSRNFFGKKVYPTIPTENLFTFLRSDKKFDTLYEDYTDANELENIIHIIINEVTHGKLSVDESGNFQFQDSITNHSVNITNLSAGLKIFAVLQRLLENGTCKKGDILLIDEPEVNLHPEWQVIFAEILVLLQKKIGLVIYVNTHSPYFVRAIEVKMAEYGIADKGKFYLMQECEDGLCESKDVTKETEQIYSLLYKPLEEL